MTATIFSASNDLIVVLVTLPWSSSPCPITVLVVAVRAIVRRHKTWQEVKDQGEGQP